MTPFLSFENHGVQFDYPEDWHVSEQVDETQLAISVESPGSAFWMLAIIQGRPTADEVIASAIESFQEEYESCDVYQIEEQICMLPTVACDLDFESVEMINRASVRACETDRFTIFVLHQCPQTEEDDFREDLSKMTSSLIWTEDDVDLSGFDNLAGLEL